MNKTLILVITEDVQNQNLITASLKTHDYRYLTGQNGKTAIMEASTHNPDIVLIDSQLKDMYSKDVIKKIRSWSNIPIIVIGNSDEKEERIELLDSGADDYILKPFYVEELLARIRVSERHLSFMKNQLVKEAPIFKNGRLIIDYSSGCTYLGDDELYLTPTEYKLLCILSQNVGKVLTRNYLTQKIWGRSWDSDAYSLRVFIASLRKKLNSGTNYEEYIQTFPGTGYRMIKIG